MPRKGSSSFIESHGPNDAAVREGIAWLISEAAKSGGKGLLAIYAKANLKNYAGSTFAAVFSALGKSGTANVGQTTVILFTGSTKDIMHWNGPILVLHGSQALLDKVDALEGDARVLLIPWNRAEADNWINTWQAAELVEGKVKPHAAVPLLPAVTAAAIRWLTDSVNLNTGIVHPSDKEQAIEMIETLFHKGALPDTEMMRQELIRNGWTPADAQSVKKLAETIREGGRPRSSKGSANSELWDLWNTK